MFKPGRLFTYVRVLGVLSAIALVVFAASPVLAQETRSAFVAAVDKDGNAVADMTAADFELKIAGKPVPITSADLTTKKMRIALVIADGGIGAYQQSMATVIEKLISAAEFKLVAVVDQPNVIQDWTSEPEKLVDGVTKMGARTSVRASSQTMEAINETVKTMAKEGERPVMIVMRLGGEPQTSIRADVVRNAVRNSGTRLYVISPTGGNQTGLDLGVVLNDVSRESGGHHDQVAQTTAAKVIDTLINELITQYEVVYTPPAGLKATDKMEITTKKKGLKLYAPSRMPD